MRVTTKGRYGLRAITNLARAASDKPIPIKKIAGDEDISPEFLEQIFFKLKKQGIISSVRGPGGGFMLDMAPEEITVKNIFDAVGEGLEITPCTGDVSCVRADSCSVHEVWKEASDLIVNYFEGLTLRRVMDMENTKAMDHLMSGKEITI